MSAFANTAPARLATRLTFFAAGFAMACCAPLIPFIKQNVGANESQFGLLLLCFGLGSIFAMPVAGLLAARQGPRIYDVARRLWAYYFSTDFSHGPKPLDFGDDAVHFWSGTRHH